MRVLRFAVAAVVVGLVAACSGSPGASQNPGGGGGDGPTTPPAVTNAPVESLSGGGAGSGGNTGGGSGQMHIEISGPVEVSGDYPFFAFGSRFGGEAGVQLNFTNEGSDAIASISGIQGTFVITYVSEQLTANSQVCELTDWNIGATSGSGSFDCKDGFATKLDGTYLTGVRIKGNFEASQ